MKVWIDIENPPQVQYLLPFVPAFQAAGADTVITARDYGGTLAMLERAGVDVRAFGSKAGRAKSRKVIALLGRARQLHRYFAATGTPDVLLAASRPAAVAAWRMRIPSLIIGDYEYANVSLYRLTGSTILYPDVIDPEVFRARGLRADQVVPFKGLKEDLTFAGVDVEAVVPYDLGPVPTGVARVLFRPPSETSHYYQRESTEMARAALVQLAESGVLVVFSPREQDQVAYLDGLRWTHRPVVLDQPVPFLSLLKSADAIVCGGGTMLREAAYLGVPAYTILQSEIGGVDRWLEQTGRATVLSSPEDLRQIRFSRRGPLEPLHSNPHLIDELVSIVSARAGTRPGLAPRLAAA